MKNLVYVSFTRFPAEKAHALYMAKVCDAFAALDHDVELWVPRRFAVMQTNPYEFYGVKNFKIRRLLCLDLLPLSFGKALWHKLGVGTFALTAMIRMFFSSRDTVYFTNDVFIALVATFAARQVVLEVHDYPETATWLYQKTLARVYRVLTNNHQKVDRLQTDFGIAPENIIAVHNGVSIDEFDLAITQAEARQLVGLELGKKYVLYTGHLYDWKGAEVLAEAAKEMPSVEVVFVGGTTEDVTEMKEKYQSVTNVHFLGYQPHQTIPAFLKAADVLVLPNSGKHDLSLYHTSPMKLFEYMASQKPIVASDIPAIREILNPENAILLEPDNPAKLSQAIVGITHYGTSTASLVERAYANVQQYTWSARAATISQRL